jgi:hypothetical protein
MDRAAVISALRSGLIEVEPFMLDFFLKGEDASLLPRFAKIIPNPGRMKSQSFNYTAAFPQLNHWVDKRKVQEVFSKEFFLEYSKFEGTWEYNTDDIERKDTLWKLQDLAQEIGAAMPGEKVRLALAPIRANALCPYDGQNVFDTDHAQPDDTTFSNIVEVGMAGAAPTPTEASAMLKAVKMRLLANRLMKQTLVQSSSFDSGLMIVTSDEGTYAVLDDLRTKDVIDATTNSWKGRFELLMDFSAYEGPQQIFDAYLDLPGLPKAVLFGVSKDVGGLEGDTKDVFDTRMAKIGVDAEYAVYPGLPHAVCRATPE